jgi:hypothetical protein
MATTSTATVKTPFLEIIKRNLTSIVPGLTTSAGVTGIGTKKKTPTGIHLDPLCSTANYIDNLVASEDPHKLRLTIEQILRRLDLNLENQYLLFQKKVIELLDNHFSLFMQFQVKVIEELNKVGIAQIEEVPLEFYQVLNADEVEQDNAKLIKEIIDEDLH